MAAPTVYNLNCASLSAAAEALSEALEALEDTLAAGDGDVEQEPSLAEVHQQQEEVALEDDKDAPQGKRRLQC